MTSAAGTAQRMLSALLAAGSESELVARQRPAAPAARSPAIRSAKRLDLVHTASYWRILRTRGPAADADQETLLDARARAEAPVYERNIENYIGCVRTPVGAIGPLRINGLFAQGDYYVPLATTEAALVASYGRGARLISAAGGCAAAVLAEGIHRAPGFAFRDLTDAGRFVRWVLAEEPALRAAAQSTTRHGKLVGIAPHMEGDHVYLLCTYTTGDAAGQNMVTLATEALCRDIEARCPVTPLYWFVETNLSGDKKATAVGFTGVRGRKACAEVLLPAELVRTHLPTSAERMHD